MGVFNICVTCKQEFIGPPGECGICAMPGLLPPSKPRMPSQIESLQRALAETAIELGCYKDLCKAQDDLLVCYRIGKIARGGDASERVDKAKERLRECKREKVRR